MDEGATRHMFGPSFNKNMWLAMLLNPLHVSPRLFVPRQRKRLCGPQSSRANLNLRLIPKTFILHSCGLPEVVGSPVLPYGGRYTCRHPLCFWKLPITTLLPLGQLTGISPNPAWPRQDDQAQCAIVDLSENLVALLGVTKR